MSNKEEHEKKKKVVKNRSSKSEDIEGAINGICEHLPDGWVIKLCAEKGAAWVECWGPGGGSQLPDSADKDLWEELNDAFKMVLGKDSNKEG
jgi:hypothetical protein